MGFIADSLGLSTDKPKVTGVTEDSYIVPPPPMIENNTDLSDDNMKHHRISRDEYYLRIAEVVALRGTCLRRKFGSIIVNNDRIVSSGYAGAPRGRMNCCDIGECFRIKNNIPQGSGYDKCRSTHAEVNAIISASKEEMDGATMYLVGIENDGSYTNACCCSMCKRVVINSGIKEVVARQMDGSWITYKTQDWIINDDSLDITHVGY